MVKTYSVSLLAASVMLALSSSQAHGEEGLELVDLETAPDAYVTTPGGINSLGEAVINNTNLWNQNIRIDLLDPEEFEDYDLDDLSDAEYRAIRNLLNSTSGRGANPAYQPLGERISHLFDGQVTVLDGFDRIDPETNRETDSVNVLASDINTRQIVVGQASEPYERRLTTDLSGDDVYYFMRDSFPRAFAWVNGSVNFFQGNDDLYLGGTSNAVAINENNQVVGYAAIASTQALTDRITACQTPPAASEDGDSDDDDNDNGSHLSNEELQTCVWRFWYNYEVHALAQSGARSPIFIEQAYLWEVDDNGELLNKQHLGAFEPRPPEPDEDSDEEPEEPQPLTSRAYDINNEGVAVGRAVRPITFPNGSYATAYKATVYRDGRIIPVEEDDDTNNFPSSAVAINDNGIIAGYRLQFTGTQNVNRLFIADVNNLEAGITTPQGFFDTSNWQPKAINNHNQIVGQGQRSIDGARTQVGFLYDMDSDEIVDLNTLLPCNSGYRIVDAYDINDAGDILALATTQVAIPVDGNDESDQRMRTVRLQAGSVEACGVELEPYERQGAAVHPLLAGFIALISVLITRRRLRNRT